jgi:hypothetical protein
MPRNSKFQATDMAALLNMPDVKNIKYRKIQIDN